MVRHVFYPERQKVNTGQIDFPSAALPVRPRCGEFCIWRSEKNRWRKIWRLTPFVCYTQIIKTNQTIR